MTNIGELWTEGDVQIDGHLCGNFNCAQLIVGRDADITGAIIAKEVVVRGKITGTIRASRGIPPLHGVHVFAASVSAMDASPMFSWVSSRPRQR